MVVLEQGGSILERRSDYADFKPTSDGGVGYRAYATHQHPNDCFMAVAARYYDLTPPGYLGEVACGVNTSPGFVTKYRDAMGLALTLQQPMSIAWSAALVEGQCKAFAEASRWVDWTAFRRARPSVAIVVDKPDKTQVKRLAQFEEAMASLPMDYEYLSPAMPTEGYVLVLDARGDSAEPPSPEALAKSVGEQTPLRLSPGNHCSYALSADRRCLLAYIRNATHYVIGLCDIRSVEKYRLADRERDLRLELRGFPDPSHYRVWDAASAELLREGEFTGGAPLDLGRTAQDILLLVAPR
jgi:hypothetical protein